MCTLQPNTKYIVKGNLTMKSKLRLIGINDDIPNDWNWTVKC